MWGKCGRTGPETLWFGMGQEGSVAVGIVKVAHGRESSDIRCGVLCLDSTLTSGLTIGNFGPRHPAERPCDVEKGFQFRYLGCSETEAAVTSLEDI